MRKIFAILLLIPIFLLIPFNSLEASAKVMWGKNELKVGQIGKITVLKPIDLWKDVNGKLVKERVLYPPNAYRVYGYRDAYGGQYNVGGGKWVTKIPTHIKYEAAPESKLALLNPKKEAVEPQIEGDYAWANHKFIAHAMGGIDGKTYTNSLEAFKHNYDNGHRVFEVDFALTSDGHLVARHDWRESYAKQLQQIIPEDKKNQPLTLEEFKNLKVNEKYTPLSFYDVAVLMSEYKDIYIVTDTKFTVDPEVTKQFTELVSTAKEVDPTILDRIVPQIYNEPMLDIIMKVYDFDSFIYTLYNRYSFNEDDAVKFVDEKGIKVVATYEQRYTDDFVKKLEEKGVLTFMHTFNTVEGIEKYKEKGVQGFYTDFLLP